MFTDLPEVKTAPAIPMWLGSRISVAPSPSPILEKSSFVFSSLRNSVERSALSMRVASDMTLPRSMPRSISAVTSETRLKNSISWEWKRFIFSPYCVLCRTIDTWVVIISRSCMSRFVKWPRCLFRAWATPMTSPLIVRMGTQRIERVR